MTVLDIMVDYDDVIIPWFETVDQHLVDAWGAPETPCRVWSMHDHYGRTREEWQVIVTQAVAAGLYTHTEPFPYAAEALRRLKWMGHRIHIVTARGFMAQGAEIRTWTREHAERFAIPYDTLTFAKDKLEAMEALEVTFDYAVDDGVHNFERLSDGGVNVYLHDASHNLTYDAPAGRRTPSLWSFVDLIASEHP